MAATRDMLSSGGGVGSTTATASASATTTTATAERHRFSLLHLDEGEDYVGGYIGHCKAPTGALPLALENTIGDHAHGKLRGRVRLLSRSLLFDPDDVAVPMLKFPLAAVSRMEDTGGVHAAFELVCSRIVHIRPGGEDAPYHVEKDCTLPWQFDLAYAPVSKVLEPALELLAAGGPNIHTTPR